MDIMTVDENGRAWAFNDPEVRNKAARELMLDTLLFHTGSPVCTYFSTNMNLNVSRLGKEALERRLSRAMVHLKFICCLYRYQV